MCVCVCVCVQVGDDVNVIWEDGQFYTATVMRMYRDGNILVCVLCVCVCVCVSARARVGVCVCVLVHVQAHARLWEREGRREAGGAPARCALRARAHSLVRFNCYGPKKL